MPLKTSRGRPRSPATDSAILSAAYDLLEREGYAGFSMEAVARRAGARGDIAGAVRRGDDPPAGEALRDIDDALKALKQFRDSVLVRPVPGLGYRQYPRLREEIQTVSGMVSRPLMPPTAGELQRLAELKTETDQAQARLDALIRDRIAPINQLLGGTPHVIVPRAGAGAGAGG